MSSSRLILIVNRTPRNAALLRSFLEQRGYVAAIAGSMDELDQALDSSADFRLALMDVSGFDPSIWVRCGRLHAGGIPFLVISSSSRPVGTEEGLRHGAKGVLTKPLAMTELSNLIDSLVS